MNNSSSNPPAADPNPNPPNNNNEKKNPPKWPPQSTTLLTPPQTPQIQHPQKQTNWHWPSMHPQQQFQHGCGQYGQYAPVRYFMMHPPPPIPVWQHQLYNGQQQNHQIHSQPTKFESTNHQNENWSSQEMRRLLNTQNEFIKELTKKTNDLEGQKNDLEGQIKELWEKMETTENEERETNIKLEKKTAELDELLAKIEMEKGQKVDQSTETDPIELVVERPLTLPSPELDPLADELENLKNELGIKNKLVKKMEAEMEKATEELRKLMDAQNGNKEMAKRKESLENWEERMKAREQRFTEEKEFAIAQCRIEVDSRINQMEFQLLSKNTALESKDKEITRLRGLNRQLSKDLDDSKASRNRLLRDLQDMDSTKKKLLEEIWIEKEKLKKQADRCEQLNLELADKDGKIAEKDEELAIKNEEMEKMMEKHKIAMNSTLDAYKMALGQNDERVQKLRNEIEEKKKEIAEREEKWKLEEEENWQILMMAENEQDRLKKEIAKMKLEKEEWGDKEAKALANAKKYKLKLAEANKEIGKLQSDVAKLESLVRTADKENKEKQKQLDKMEAEMEENKKKELILRIKKEIDQPPKSTFDEIIQAMDKTPTPKQKGK